MIYTFSYCSWMKWQICFSKYSKSNIIKRWRSRKKHAFNLDVSQDLEDIVYFCMCVSHVICIDFNTLVNSLQRCFILLLPHSLSLFAVWSLVSAFLFLITPLYYLLLPPSFQIFGFCNHLWYMCMLGKYGEFGKLIPGKFCNLEGNCTFLRDILAILRANWSFGGQKCINYY